jgi:hypothetical protein
METTTSQLASFMSENIDQISAALSAFQGVVEQPKLEKEVKVKTKSGGSYSFKYADLSACVKAATQALKGCNLSVCQLISNGKLITILSHKSGQWFKSELMLPTQTTDYQAYGSAITYLKRYSYCAILGIVADTDDDANIACGNQAEFKERKQQPAAAFTEAQLKEALEELGRCTTPDHITALWKKWSTAVPALCMKGTEFYNAVGEKSHTMTNPAK